MSHSDGVGREIVDEGDLACLEGVEDKKLIKIWAREDRNLSTSIVKIDNDGGLVSEFIWGEVDEAEGTPLLEMARYGE